MMTDLYLPFSHGFTMHFKLAMFIDELISCIRLLYCDVTPEQRDQLLLVIRYVSFHDVHAGA